MEIYSLNNRLIKAKYCDELMKDLIDLETKNFEKYRENREEFNVRNIRKYRPKIEIINPLFVEYKPITL
jgi:hypothetical protein